MIEAVPNSKDEGLYFCDQKVAVQSKQSEFYHQLKGSC